MKKYLFSIIVLHFMFTASAQDSIKIYKEVPNAKRSRITEKRAVDQAGMVRISNVTDPTLTIFKPTKEKNNGVAVIICPGGGYARLAFSHEGVDVAKALNNWGITAFVLKYRLPNDTIMQDKSIAPLQDAQRAIQLVKERASEW